MKCVVSGLNDHDDRTVTGSVFGASCSFSYAAVPGNNSVVADIEELLRCIQACATGNSTPVAVDCGVWVSMPVQGSSYIAFSRARQTPISCPHNMSFNVILLAETVTSITTVMVVCDLQSVACYRYLNTSTKHIKNFVFANTTKLRYVFKPIRMLDYHPLSPTTDMVNISNIGYDSLNLAIGIRCSMDFGMVLSFISSYMS